MPGEPLQNLARLADIVHEFAQMRIFVRIVTYEIAELEIQLAEFFIAERRRRIVEREAEAEARAATDEAEASASPLGRSS